MENVIKRNKILCNIFSVVFFIVNFVLCVVMFWEKGIMASLFETEIKLSPICITLSFVFIVLNCLLVGFGTWLKNKVMIFLPALYGFILILSFILLGFFSSGSINDVEMYNLVQNILFVVLAPIYGFVWILGPISIVVFLALLVTSVVVLIKLFKADRSLGKK